MYTVVASEAKVASRLIGIVERRKPHQQAQVERASERVAKEGLLAEVVNKRVAKGRRE